MRTIAILITAAGLAVPGAAQTKHVYPHQASDAEGSISVDSHRGGAPWWSNPSQVPGTQHFRMQLISDLPATVQGNITAIAFRRDGSALQGRALENFFLEIEATMSTAPTTAATAATAFAANVGANVVQVISRKNLAIGTKEFYGTFPEPFDYTFVLDQPFFYSGAGSLCFDVKHYQNDMAHPLRPYALTVALDSMTGSKQGPALYNGGRCASQIYWEPPIEFRGELFVDDTITPPRLRYYAHRQYGMHHSRGFLVASLARMTPGVVPPGPGACGLFEMDFNQQFLFAISDSDGIYGRVRWPKTASTYLIDLPYDPLWTGAQWYAQELNLDVHTRFLSATNWCLNQVPAYLPPGTNFGLRTVWAEGPGSHTATQGTLGTLGVGPVVEYTTQ